MSYTPEEKEALLNTKCSSCGGDSCSTCGDGCSSCGEENPCKYGKVIGDIQVGSYIKKTTLSEADCKENIKLEGFRVTSVDGTISVITDLTNGIFDISKPCCPDKDEMVKVNVDDCAGYLGEKIVGCANQITTVNTITKVDGCKYLQICTDPSKLPQNTGEIKWSEDCDLGYLSDILNTGYGLQIIDNGCNPIISEKQDIFPSATANVIGTTTFTRETEAPINNGGGSPNTGGGIIPTDSDFGYYAIDCDGLTDVIGTGLSIGTQQVSWIESSGPVIGIVVDIEGYYDVNATLQNLVNHGVSSIRTFIGIDGSMKKPLVDMKEDSRNGRQTAINPTLTSDNDSDLQCVSHSLYKRKILLKEGDFIFLGGRISTDVRTGNGAGMKGENKLKTEAFGLGPNSTQQSSGEGITAFLQVEWNSDINGARRYIQ